jgi:hypothetical protein
LFSSNYNNFWFLLRVVVFYFHTSSPLIQTHTHDAQQQPASAISLEAMFAEVQVRLACLFSALTPSTYSTAFTHSATVRNNPKPLPTQLSITAFHACGHRTRPIPLLSDTPPTTSNVLVFQQSHTTQRRRRTKKHFSNANTNKTTTNHSSTPQKIYKEELKVLQDAEVKMRKLMVRLAASYCTQISLTAAAAPLYTQQTKHRVGKHDTHKRLTNHRHTQILDYTTSKTTPTLHTSIRTNANVPCMYYTTTHNHPNNTSFVRSEWRRCVADKPGADAVNQCIPQ